MWYILICWFLKFGSLYCEKSSNMEKKRNILLNLLNKPKFLVPDSSVHLVHTTGLTQNWPSFFHCSLECLKSHHHQVTNLLFNWTSTTYTLGGSRNSFRGLWRWCFWCSKTEKCIFAAVAKKTQYQCFESQRTHTSKSNIGNEYFKIFQIRFSNSWSCL